MALLQSVKFNIIDLMFSVTKPGTQAQCNNRPDGKKIYLVYIYIEALGSPLLHIYIGTLSSPLLYVAIVRRIISVYICIEALGSPLLYASMTRRIISVYLYRSSQFATAVYTNGEKNCYLTRADQNTGGAACG